MHLSRKLTCALILLVALAAPMAPGAEPDIIKQIPADAQFVVVIPNIGLLSEKVTTFSRTLGLQQAELDNPLEQFKNMSGLGAGLDDHGGLAVVLPTLPIGGGQPDALVFVPVKDYAAFAGQLGAQGEGISAVEFQGQPAFVKKSGSYAVLSNQRALIEAYKPATGFTQRAGALAGQLLSGSDAVVFADITQLAPVFGPVIQMQMEEIKTQARLAGGAQGAQAAAMLDAMGASVQAFIRDGQAVAAGVNVSDKGVGLSFAAQFKPGSPLATTFAKAPAGELAFNRLPKKPYFFAGSMNFASLPFESWLDAVVAAVPPGAGFDALVKATVDLMKQSGSSSQFMWLPPNLAGGGGFVNTVAVYESKNPAAFIAAQRKIIEQMNGMELAPGLIYRTRYTVGAVDVDGRKVDQFEQKMDVPPDVQQQAGPLGGLIFGGTTGYVAPVDGAVVVVSGGDPTQLKETIAAASGQGGLSGDEQIKTIRPNLLGSRVLEGYLGLGAGIQFANNFLSLAGPQMVIEVPKDLPPVAVSVSAGGSGAGASVYVPMPVLVTGQKAINKFRGGSPGTSGAAAAAPEVKSEHVAELTDDNFQAEVVDSAQPVLVDFWAVWCAPCRSQAPIVAGLAEQYQGKLKVGKIDIDKHPDTADLYQVEAIPTLLLIKDGQVVQKFVGLTSKEKLEEAIKKAIQ